MIFPQLADRIRDLFEPADWRWALFCAPAFFLILTTGWLGGHPVQAVIAAGSALTVGLGAGRSLGDHHWPAMPVTLLGTAIVTFAGSLIGSTLWATLICTSLVAAVTALLALRNENWWWVALQIAIAFLIACHFSGNLNQATNRAALVLAGGAMQIFIAGTLAWFLPSDSVPSQPAAPPEVSHIADPLVVRAAICVPLTLLLAHSFHLHNAYWAPISALLVLKPGLQATQWRGLARVSGTIAGCAAASLYSFAMVGLPPLMIAGAGLAAGLTFALQWAKYAIFSTCMTLTIVLMLDFATGDPAGNAIHRIVATLFGGAMALAFASIGPRRDRSAAASGDGKNDAGTPEIP